MSDPLADVREDADAKAWFYLDHRHDIETWAGLRAEGRQLLDKHLVGIAALLERRRRVSGAMRPVVSQLKGEWSRTFPFWRYVQLPAGAPVDPQEFLRDILAIYRQLWEAAAPRLDALHLDSTESEGER